LFVICYLEIRISLVPQQPARPPGAGGEPRIKEKDVMLGVIPPAGVPLARFHPDLLDLRLWSFRTSPEASGRGEIAFICQNDPISHPDKIGTRNDLCCYFLRPDPGLIFLRF
jgi:hypothetical protein